jgi:predicted DNA binding CopG/RHH family protein
MLIMKKEYDLKKLKERPGKVRASPDAAKIPISLRLEANILAAIKTEAEELGIPYQTHIGSILHQYATGALVLKKTVELLKKLSAL